MTGMKKKASILLIFLILLLSAAAGREKKNLRRALILGDSHAHALEDLIRDYSPSPAWDFDVKGVSSSGLARRDFFDWIGFSGKDECDGYDAYVIILGTNDGQNSSTAKDYAFGSLEWEYLYTARVEHLLTRLENRGPVLWVTPPPAASEELRRKTEYLQALIGEVCRSRGASVLDSSLILGYGNYLREDGIHLTREGSERLLKGIEEALGQLFSE
jgi:hypothetical protein